MDHEKHEKHKKCSSRIVTGTPGGVGVLKNRVVAER